LLLLAINDSLTLLELVLLHRRVTRLPPLAPRQNERAPGVFAMTDITVSFFSDLNAAIRTRRVSFPRATRPMLHKDIRQSMEPQEFFACYHAPDGGIVALDRQGVTVRI
jgi:hypothetical protein